MKGNLMDFYLDEDLIKKGAEHQNVKEIKKEMVDDDGDLLPSG